MNEIERFEATVGTVKSWAADGESWTPWRSVRCAGDPTLDLVSLSEESGGVSTNLLAERGWKPGDGDALVDYVPVLEVLGELEAGEGEAIFENAPASVFDLLNGLPATRHLCPMSGVQISTTRGDGWLVIEFRGGSGEDYAPSAQVSVGLRTRDSAVIAVVLAGNTERCCEILGESAADATSESAWCDAPW